MRKHVLLYTTMALVACGGDWMTGPGRSVELSHESIQGRWVHTESLHIRVGNPAIRERLEISPDKGSILEFDGAGGVQHSRYVDGGFLPHEYTISADTLTIFFNYQAEVSTSRLILTLRGITFDFDGDGTGEDAIEVLTYQKGKD